MKQKHFQQPSFIAFAVFVIVSAATGVCGATFSGSLTAADPVFNRPVSCAALSGVGTAVHYKTFNFTIAVPQSMTISLSSTDGAVFTTPSDSASIDTFLTLYGTGGFNPASPLANCLQVNDDANGATDRRSRIVTGVLPVGTYTYVVASFDNLPAGASVLPWTYTGFISNLLVPTAAGVRITGRVVSADGRGIYGARVSMTDATGVTRTALTNNFGYYTIKDVRAGESYVFNVTSKQFQFAPQVLTVADDLAALDFTALP